MICNQNVFLCTYHLKIGGQPENVYVFVSLRRMAGAMVKRIDVEKVKKDGEICPGGDIRIVKNQWLRAAFQSSGLDRVPRETAMRLALERVVRKKHMRAKLRFTIYYYVTYLFCHKICVTDENKAG